ASFLWVSCDNQETANQEGQTEEVADAAPKALDINKFDELADGLANQVVEITGTCVHTCKHGGTKMFITGNDPDFRLKVTATDESGNFNLEMEGNDYVVVGVLDEYRMDMAEMDKMEADVLAEHGFEGETVEDMKHKKNETESEHADHSGDDHQETEGSCDAELAQIADLRKEAKENGKGYLSFYSILATSYKESK
ncbi:MAG: hypothetical protein GQ527_13465, partial [Bacteroidales bacterium]|nr:hypothetical protein [Bacteroidales bacterium]